MPRRYRLPPPATMRKAGRGVTQGFGGYAERASTALVSGGAGDAPPPRRTVDANVPGACLMLVRFVDGDSGGNAVVTVHDPHANVAALVAALAPGRPPATVAVDGREVRCAQPLDRAGIGDGSEVVIAAGRGSDAPSARTRAVAELVVVDGLDVGRRLPLPPGHHVVGRSDDGPKGAVADLAVADPTVSRRHLDVTVAADATVTVADAGSTNGSTLDGRPLDASATVAPAGTVISCGATRLLLEAPPIAASRLPPPCRGATTRPLHRRPRPPFPEGEAPLAAPAPPDPPPAVTPVGVVGVAASLALGGLMVVLLHAWTYAAFALLGPVLLVANAVDSRRRRRRWRRGGDRRRYRELAGFADALAQRGQAERRRRRRLHPGPAAAVEQTRTAPQSCWQRRASDPDAYLVSLGSGTVPWVPPVVGDPAGWPEDLAALVERHRALDGAAVACPLDPAAPIAVVGHRSAAVGLVRSIVVQAVVDQGPADLGVAVLAGEEHALAWDWCGWLPHARRPDGDHLLAGDAAAGEAVAAALIGPTRGPDREAAGPLRTIVVIDDPDQLGARRSPARSLLRTAADPGTGLVAVVVVEHPHDVPAACRTVLQVTEAGELAGPPWLVAGPARLAGVAVDTAEEVARRLARFDDPELDDADRHLPATVALGDLLTFDASSPRAVAARWRAAGWDPHAHGVIGVAQDGPLVVDLVADGPHGLVAGTTGAGKSELLRTLVASLALGATPVHLTFVLVDFKGGSAFDACSRLPHVTGVVTDLDDHLAARALRCLEAELRHRERCLREAAVDDLAAYRRRAVSGSGRLEALPRLVVVIDEFATLAAEVPDFVDALVAVAQRGRSLGVHVVLATQRPSGAVSDHIRANTNLRVALRVQDEGDSRDVIDRPDA
ncbi:MAG: FtsK/SpoIIIE domain-containing protein, partial [Acidimicrobiales bacterium]